MAGYIKGWTAKVGKLINYELAITKCKAFMNNYEWGSAECYELGYNEEDGRNKEQHGTKKNYELQTGQIALIYS
jgi:hypothetical protein